MNISMASIDYRKATVAQRERFSFTKTAAADAVRRAVEEFGAQGCVLLVTCNRTELWVTGRDCRPYELLCKLKGCGLNDYAGYFVTREGGKAVQHLYELACGLDSRIFGEDQILTQVKEAVALSREQHAAGSVLEALFRSAVSAAKRVKSTMRLSSAAPSAAASAVELLKRECNGLKDVPCLVIGNGEMGRLAAEYLVDEGGLVSMTLRQYKSREAVIPAGCRVIPYEERLTYLPHMRAIISATLSPHYTLRRAELERLPKAPRCYIDLAVPRDIDTEIALLPGAKLYDIDTLGISAVREQEERQAEKARGIIAEYRKEFENWYFFRGYVPWIQEISYQTALDADSRLRQPLQKLVKDRNTEEALQELMHQAGEKAVSRLLYGLRENLPHNAWEECLNGLKEAAYKGEELYKPVSSLYGPSLPAKEEEQPESLKFPIYVDLFQKPVVVVGGGKIAARRVETLLPFGCRVTVVSPSLCARLENLRDEGRIAYRERKFRPGDCTGAALVTTCTDDRDVNRQVAEECARIRVPVSVADRREEGTFYFPAVITDGEVTVGVASCGSKHSDVRRVADAIRARKNEIFGKKENER